MIYCGVLLVFRIPDLAHFQTCLVCTYQDGSCTLLQVQRMLDCSDLYLHISSSNIMALNDEMCSVFGDRCLLQDYCKTAISNNQLQLLSRQAIRPADALKMRANNTYRYFGGLLNVACHSNGFSNQ